MKCMEKQYNHHSIQYIHFKRTQAIVNTMHLNKKSKRKKKKLKRNPDKTKYKKRKTHNTEYKKTKQTINTLSVSTIIIKEID